MLPARVSNPGPLTYEAGALPIALRGLDDCARSVIFYMYVHVTHHGSNIRDTIILCRAYFGGKYLIFNVFV